MNQFGTFYGVGVGPGDPELITLKAARLIESADVISYLVNDQGHSHALSIAQTIVDSVQAERKNDIEYFEVHMPMSRDTSIGTEVYDKAVVKIAEYLRSGKQVVFLCEGDPLFFGSAAYFLERLQPDFTCEIIPGITSPQSASAALNTPLTMLKESYAVISGRHSDDSILQTLTNHDTVIIMKAGSSRPRLLCLIEKAGRLAHGTYLEFIGRDNQAVFHDLSELDKSESGPYFSLFMITNPSRGRS